MTIRIPHGALVVLVGPSASGKSTWAERWFRLDQIVSTDRLRALVGEAEDDQRAGADAFDVLDLVVDRRLARGLVTVVDSLGLDAERRAAWRELARRRRRPCHAVVFDVPADECRRRNRARSRPVPAKVLSGQIRRSEAAKVAVADEGFDGVHAPSDAAVVPAPFAGSGPIAERQRTDPVPLRFGLQIPSFTWPDGDVAIGSRLVSMAAEAEEAGFTSIWLMDHFIQIPFVGRHWEPMLDSYTTLGFLAAHTTTARLGVLVSGITYRNVAHLGKIVATLDILSSGRANCGLGAAWFDQEHHAYGWRFPPLAERYELLEDALELLPLLWGPGTPAYEGRRINVPSAVGYPRPLQEHVPILVGGSGERRTLRLVARHADACNLFGEAEVVGHKVSVLREHCRAEDRDPGEIAVTQLSGALAAPDHDALGRRVDRLRGSASPEEFARRHNAATVDEHIGRFRALADAGVDEAIVSIADAGDPGSVERFAPVVAAFR